MQRHPLTRTLTLNTTTAAQVESEFETVLTKLGMNGAMHGAALFVAFDQVFDPIWTLLVIAGPNPIFG